MKPRPAVGMELSVAEAAEAAEVAADAMGQEDILLPTAPTAGLQVHLEYSFGGNTVCRSDPV